MPAYASICQHKGSTAAIEPSQIPIRSPLLRFPRPTSSNISSKIPKIATKTSNLAPRWPPRAPKMAPETSNLVHQGSKMPPATCTKPRKLRCERHLRMMQTIFTLLRLFNLKLATKFATKASKMAKDCLISAPRRPKTAPRWPQRGPRWLRHGHTKPHKYRYDVHFFGLQGQLRPT